MNNVGGSLNI